MEELLNKYLNEIVDKTKIADVYFAPNSVVGNISTEDLVYLLNTLNIKTIINLEKLISCALDIENILNKKLPSKIKDLYKNLENFKPLK
jgi:hypothetical protein